MITNLLIIMITSNLKLKEHQHLRVVTNIMMKIA